MQNTEKSPTKDKWGGKNRDRYEKLADFFWEQFWVTITVEEFKRRTGVISDQK